MDLIVWQFIRASGLLALMLLTASAVTGILVKSRAADSVVRRAWMYEAHQSLSFAALGLVVVHVVFIQLNSHVRFDIASTFVPFISEWKPLPTALGILGMYLAAALVTSSHLRGVIGQKGWRALHYTSAIAWVAAMLHGVLAGSDTGGAAVQSLYWGQAGLVVLATSYRILLPLPPKPTGALQPAESRGS